jgi:signal peptidase II
MLRDELRRRVPYALLMFLVVAIDQITKLLVLNALPIHDSRPIIDGLLSLSHVRNRGAAFGFLSDADLPHQDLIFSIVSLAALGAIIIYSLRIPARSRLPQTALALVTGGAIGNLLDRLRLGYVVDFVHVYWKQFEWWDFNVADACISVGVTLLLLDVVLAPRAAGEPPKPDVGQPATLAGRSE